MGRWSAIIGGMIIAAAVGYLAGYLRWAKDASQAQHAVHRLTEVTSELVDLQHRREELQQRLEQLGKEQERLAQENQLLRKEQVTQQLVTGQGGELPARPPK